MDDRCLLLFQAAGTQYGLRLDAVEQVLHAVHITPISGVPANVCGIVKVHGSLLPVIDLRSRNSSAPRPVALSDQLIVVQTPSRRVLLLVEAVLDLYFGDAHSEVGTESLLADAKQLEGAVTTQDGFVLIQNIDRFFSLGEERQLRQALASA